MSGPGAKLQEHKMKMGLFRLLKAINCCKRGHIRTTANTYVAPNSNTLTCKDCIKIMQEPGGPV